MTVDKLNASLEAGNHILRITITGNNCNIDKIELKCNTSGIISILDDDMDGKNAPSYNLSGQKVGSGYKGIVIRNGRKVMK